MQDLLNQLSKSGYLSLDKVDFKHLAVEAGLSALFAAVGVGVAYLSGHPIGTVTPALIWALTVASSALKKALTDNESRLQ